MTNQELQSLRNMGNEAEAAADEIERLRAELLREHADHKQTLADVDALVTAAYHSCAKLAEDARVPFGAGAADFNQGCEAAAERIRSARRPPRQEQPV